jgi:hypothetical protein
MDAINPYGYFLNEPWEPNQPLIDAIRANIDRFDLFIWSGGGSRYASDWAMRLGLDDLEPACLMKDIDSFPLVRRGDIVVDDQILEVEGTLFFPEDLSWVGAI